MFKAKDSFSGFSVDNLGTAKKFYQEILGLRVDDTGMGLRIHFQGEVVVFAYEKEDHLPATYTMMNLVVDDIDDAIKELTTKGIKFEHYENMTDAKGIARGKEKNQGPDIAWFKDPAGNIISVLEN